MAQGSVVVDWGNNGTPLWIIADDFGLSPSVNEGILDLLGQKRISGTSIMVGFPEALDGAGRLKAFEKTASLGLHLTLTDQRPLTKGQSFCDENGQFVALGTFMMRAFMGRLDENEVYQEIKAQHERFITLMGFAPHHIDGHQHVHLLPTVRKALLRFLKTLSPKPWVRTCHIDLKTVGTLRPYGVKMFVLNSLSFGLLKKFEQSDIPHNNQFLGIYDFSRDAPYQKLFKIWLSCVKRTDVKGKPKIPTVLMVHPAQPCSCDMLLEKRDTVTKARFKEYEVMMSKDFFLWLQNAKLDIQYKMKL